FGEDHRDGGIDALPHFHLRHDQRSLARMVDTDESIRRELTCRRVRSLLRLVRGTQRKVEGKNKSGSQAAFDETAARGTAGEIIEHVHRRLLYFAGGVFDRVADAHIGATAANVS